jgi:hypothetical protein
MWAACNEPIIQTGKGRPRKYCDAHALESKRISKREYKRRYGCKPKPVPDGLPVCCQQWHDSGKGRGIACPQHRQWQQFVSYGHRTKFRYGLAEYAEQLNAWCDGEESERNFSIITHPEPDANARPWPYGAKIEGWEDELIARIDAERRGENKCHSMRGVGVPAQRPLSGVGVS